jgi:hypothetical protein
LFTFLIVVAANVVTGFGTPWVAERVSRLLNKQRQKRLDAFIEQVRDSLMDRPWDWSPPGKPAITVEEPIEGMTDKETVNRSLGVLVRYKECGVEDEETKELLGERMEMGLREGDKLSAFVLIYKRSMWSRFRKDHWELKVSPTLFTRNGIVPGSGVPRNLWESLESFLHYEH